MNNWRAVGYIFLGWGSVFLIYALIVFFSVLSALSVFPSLAQAIIALAASAPWLILAALAYVVGVVGYYAGRESAAKPIILDKVNVGEMQKHESQHVSSKLDSLWSFIAGTLASFAVLVLQIVLGIMNGSDKISGVVLPIFYSIVAGLIVGLVALILINKINES